MVDPSMGHVGADPSRRTTRSVEKGGVAEDAHHDGGAEAAAEELVAEAGGGARRARAAEGGETAEGVGARPGELLVGGERRERGLDEIGGDATGAELAAQARGAVPARRARGDPVAGEGGVVHVTTLGEVGDDGGGDVRRGAALDQARREVARRPGPAREERAGGEPRAPGVEDGAGRAYRLKKEPPEACTTGRSSFFCSNDCSAVEKMPRTLRSKSSAFVAASRAVS